MKKAISVVYFSGTGHTEVIADALAEGAVSLGSNEVHLIKVPKNGVISDEDWKRLDNSSAIVFGAPTYMGSVAAPMKAFMDSTSPLWAQRKWADKIAGGFTNSANLSGDKLLSLQQFVIFAGQHGMIWVPPNELPKGIGRDDINRLGSFTGTMAQSDFDKGPEVVPPQSDRITARNYGRRIAEITDKFML